MRIVSRFLRKISSQGGTESLCLPKQAIRELGWKKGDTLAFYQLDQAVLLVPLSLIESGKAHTLLREIVEQYPPPAQ
mgnify:CR=1 FL=1